MIDCNENIISVVKMLGHTLGSGIRIEFDVPVDLWPVYVDSNQLEVSLLNLALNSRDSMTEGKGTITLRTRNVRLAAAAERIPGDYVCIEVEDDGRGLKREVLARIFEPFFTTKKDGRGTGLGLPQVYGFVKQSGGDIEVKSELGVGTVIKLFLPRAAAPARMLDPTAVVDEKLEDHGGQTVLVVEDNEDVAAIAVELVSDLGYAVRLARSAGEALDMLSRGSSVDAVLSDVVMPGMNGIELANVLRECYPSLPVVLATGYSDMLAQWTKDISAGIVKKPYSSDEVGTALRRALGQDRAVPAPRVT